MAEPSRLWSENGSREWFANQRRDAAATLDRRCHFTVPPRHLVGYERLNSMHLGEYQRHVRAIQFGKRLPTALYIYWDRTASLGDELDKLIARVVAAFQIGPEFNVLKFRTDELKISFLAYPEFFEEPHPSLRKAITVDLVKNRARHTDYAENINPPILHRKEAFLPPNHAKASEFAALTAAEGAAGLYAETATIGFKLNWDRLLQEKGWTLEGHALVPLSAPAEPKHAAVEFVERHKTAMTRYELSKPVKSLLEYGLMQAETTFFDYGCGPGSDVRGLQALGHTAEGWDPVYRPETPKSSADIVNLGYVLNVIEDPAERLESLVEAHRLAKRLLVVSALINETVETGRSTSFRDGILTKRNTFQKFFEQQELQQYIEDALETTAAPVSLGVFYVFRDPAELQDFLSARSRRSIDWSQISARLGLGGPRADRWESLYEENKELLDRFGAMALQLGRFPAGAEFPSLEEVTAKLGSLKRALRAFIQGGGAKDRDWSAVAAQFGIGVPAKAKWEQLCEEHKELLEAFWRKALELGRTPAPDEFAQFAELAQAVGSANKAMSLFNRKGGSEELKRAAEARKNDLLVYLGLANLRKKVPFGHLSPSLRLDIREFFGNYQRALAKGLELLFAAGDPGEIELACEDLKIGWQDEQALYIHRSLLDQLPAVLRAYVGCATTLFGDVAQADIIKIHKASGKVTFLAYDDFENKPLPQLLHRIKVNLRTRWVQAFDHSAEGQVLEQKERYLHTEAGTKI